LYESIVAVGISRGGGLLGWDGAGEGEWDALEVETVVSVEEPFCAGDLVIPIAAPVERSPLPFGVLFGSSADDTLMEGVPMAEAGPLPTARDKLDEGDSFGLVSPSPKPASLSLSFPPFLDFLEVCWPMERPREDDGEAECGPGELDLDFDSLLVKTERRDWASLWRWMREVTKLKVERWSTTSDDGGHDDGERGGAGQPGKRKGVREQE
jgi:hypothetical protein